MRNNKLWLALLAVTLYQTLSITLRLDGVSTAKILLTLLPWISFYLTFEYFVTNYHFVKRKIPVSAHNIFIMLVLLNGVNIIRGALDGSGSLTTIFGNQYISLALLTPFALVFGVNKFNLKTIHRFFFRLISIGLTVSALLILLSLDQANSNYLFAALFMVSPVVFLIGTVSYQNRNQTNKYIIYISSLLFVVFSSFVIGSRATLLRMTLLYLSNLAVYFCGNNRARWMRVIAICTLLLPSYMIMMSTNSGQSIFQAGGQFIQQIGLGASNYNIRLDTTDTRTFLYTEVFNDLERNSSLLFGKGSNGTYYSHFFHNTKRDADERLTVEVGILAILLKGGVIAVILNLALLYLAIYFAFFRANNNYVIWVGFMLIVHSLILFVENLVSYDLYNFSIWFFVGVCLSKEVRAMSNQEMQSFFDYKAKKSSKISLQRAR